MFYPDTVDHPFFLLFPVLFFFIFFIILYYKSIYFFVSRLSLFSRFYRIVPRIFGYNFEIDTVRNCLWIDLHIDFAYILFRQVAALSFAF